MVFAWSLVCCALLQRRRSGPSSSHLGERTGRLAGMWSRPDGLRSPGIAMRRATPMTDTSYLARRVAGLDEGELRPRL